MDTKRRKDPHIEKLITCQRREALTKKMNDGFMNDFRRENYYPYWG